MRIIVITVNEESERYCHLLDIVSKSLLSSQKTNNNYCILFLIWFLQFIRAVPLKVKTKRYRSLLFLITQVKCQTIQFHHNHYNQVTKQNKMRIFGFLSKKVGDLTIKYSNFPESYVKRSYEQVHRSYRSIPSLRLKT